MRAQRSEEQVRDLWSMVVGDDFVPLNVWLRRAFADPADFYRHVSIRDVVSESGALSWPLLAEEVDRLLAAHPGLAGARQKPRSSDVGA
ncbi:hypothetical protein [Microbacterium sp. EST19A]|uniref:hypothetical protein n=1 Tax=Microbacterium sp. EST19A TaxID=2862681 RepID=UPI001CBAF817|nr:hypothetical protein [Microbacterium sp. EST19A]